LIPDRKGFDVESGGERRVAEEQAPTRALRQAVGMAS
jgi:hypothetical protein